MTTFKRLNLVLAMVIAIVMVSASGASASTAKGKYGYYWDGKKNVGWCGYDDCDEQGDESHIYQCAKNQNQYDGRLTVSDWKNYRPTRIRVLYSLDQGKTFPYVKKSFYVADGDSLRFYAGSIRKGATVRIELCTMSRYYERVLFCDRYHDYQNFND